MPLLSSTGRRSARRSVFPDGASDGLLEVFSLLLDIVARFCRDLPRTSVDWTIHQMTREIAGQSGGGYHHRMVAIKGHFDGRVIVPDEPVNWPANQRLIIHVEPILERTIDFLSWVGL